MGWRPTASLATGVLALASAGHGAPPGTAAGPDWPALEAQAVDLLVRYLQVDTTNPPGNEQRAADFWRGVFGAAGIETRVFESAPGRANVVARVAGDGSRPAVVLMHHMDVVPADASYWQADPFGGEIRDGEIWGRGAIDVKGMGVANAIALLAIAQQDEPPAGDVIFLGVADEEAGGAQGAGFMVERHFELFANAGVVLNEGGFIARGDDGRVAYYAVEVAQKTPYWLRLVARGTPGHGSMPLRGSAPERLVAALGRVVAWETPLRVVAQVQRFHADTAHLAEPARREALRDLRKALADETFARAFTANPRANAMLRNTISLTALEGSSKTNVIPPEASAELDVRLLPDQDPAAFRDALAAVIDDASIEIETLLSFPPAESPTDHALFDVLAAIAERDHPGAVVTTPLSVGFTDCHFFRERGVPCYGFMPFVLGDRDYRLVHGNDERLSVENLRAGCRRLFEITARLAGASH